jgi:hypothetical protein
MENSDFSFDFEINVSKEDDQMPAFEFDESMFNNDMFSLCSELSIYSDQVSVNASDFHFEQFESLPEVMQSAEFPSVDHCKLVNRSAQDEKDYFERNMRYVQPLLDKRFAAVEKVANGEYKDFEAEVGSKNKCRGFWKSKVLPLSNAVGEKFQKLALASGLSGLTPEVSRKFYALLLLIQRLPEEEAALVLDACWQAAAIGEIDPQMQMFPNH